jgi:hypothetical protein
MQYKVPQNVDIEDKVIAGLTLRQFMFILVAGGVGLLEYYAFYQNAALRFLFFPLAIITAGIGVAFAFVKINDRPFETFVMSALKSLLAPHERIWRKDDDLEIPKHTEIPHTRGPLKPRKKSLEEVKSGLERLAMVVDSGGAIGVDSSTDRQTNVVQNVIIEPEHIQDILANTESEVSTPSVDAIMAQAKEYVTKNQKEQPISSSATTVTKKEDFEYDKLQLSDESQLTETLDKVKAKQKSLEQKLSTAKIEKFER